MRRNSAALKMSHRRAAPLMAMVFAMEDSDARGECAPSNEAAPWMTE